MLGEDDVRWILALPALPQGHSDVDVLSIHPRSATSAG
ncbi:hypothetical protein Pla52o_28000 [Novipirellula galeiformis]|uniref:Uncharacterized protein n=1 Tax=Novipirellula galeiformis TaxID=2528004 RepID=A0A5C6CIF3_9BACT|nr:hypothetical protein Pla52o_28000 [Novipirellula galeiformis]